MSVRKAKCACGAPLGDDGSCIFKCPPPWFKKHLGLMRRLRRAESRVNGEFLTPRETNDAYAKIDPHYAAYRAARTRRGTPMEKRPSEMIAVSLYVDRQDPNHLRIEGRVPEMNAMLLLQRAQEQIRIGLIAKQAVELIEKQQRVKLASVSDMPRGEPK